MTADAADDGDAPDLDALVRGLRAAADADRAADMAAYMRGQFPFLGVPTPQRRRIARPVVVAARAMPGPEVVGLMDRLWTLPEREFQYVGSDLARAGSARWDPVQLADLRRFVTTRSWWDTVDPLSSAVGELVATHPGLGAQMDRWIDDTDPWVARAALLHQLGWKDRTDADRLFAFCASRATDTGFFIRKAIGWALRDYARTAPDAVAAFVRVHPELSGLSRREALKHLPAG
jgi:3-methyladenine DNA glycosylase AlkD